MVATEAVLTNMQPVVRKTSRQMPLIGKEVFHIRTGIHSTPTQ